MNKALLWLVHIGHRSALHRLIGRLAPVADKAWFPLLAAVMSFAATLSMIVPTVPIVCALVVLSPRRWRAISFWATLGSASAGALFVHVLGHYGTLLLTEKLPELVVSSHWQHMVDWASHHGWWVLALIAVSPITQTPALFLAAILGMPAITVFSSMFTGKGVKYGLMGGLTTRAVKELSGVYEQGISAVTTKENR